MTEVLTLVLPVITPVTIPEVPIVAMPVLALLQVPPGVASERLVVAPWHKLSIPDIATGVAFTVTIFVAEHPAVVV